MPNAVRSRNALVWSLTLALIGATSAAGAPHHAHHARLKAQTGKASYFSARKAGQTTAAGKPLQPNRLIAASRTLPLGAKAKVTNLKTGKSVKVTVTDRGPFAKHRILDVSPKAATKLGMKQAGVAPVRVKPIATPAKKP